jgi:hypothetical protein
MFLVFINKNTNSKRKLAILKIIFNIILIILSEGYFMNPIEALRFFRKNKNIPQTHMLPTRSDKSYSRLESGQSKVNVSGFAGVAKYFRIITQRILSFNRP